MMSLLCVVCVCVCVCECECACRHTGSKLNPKFTGHAHLFTRQTDFFSCSKQFEPSRRSVRDVSHLCCFSGKHTSGQELLHKSPITVDFPASRSLFSSSRRHFITAVFNNLRNYFLCSFLTNLLTSFVLGAGNFQPSRRPQVGTNTMFTKSTCIFLRW